MKKVLLTGTALLGVIALATPAQANIDLDLGGYFAGYGVYTDNDEVGTAAAGDDLREFAFRRDSEFQVSGETTTDRGLTVGVHTEARTGNTVGSAASTIDEVYAYFSGSWGRVNFGVEDGAAYLLQVEAPSSDSNVDGLRTYISALNTDLFDDGTLNASASAGATLDYQHADFRRAERLTYLTPKFNGFQAGVSFASENLFLNPGQGLLGANTDDVAGAGLIEDMWEIAARWDGEFEGFGISAGAGYSDASPDVAAAAGAANSDDTQTWNVGLNVSFNAFTVGGAYHETNGGVGGVTDEDIETWLIGLGWDNGPYHVGATYLEREYGTNSLVGAVGVNADVEVERWTVGGSYTYGPGMSFRGTVAIGEADDNVAATADPDFTQVTLGTHIDF